MFSPAELTASSPISTDPAQIKAALEDAGEEEVFARVRGDIVRELLALIAELLQAGDLGVADDLRAHAGSLARGLAAGRSAIAAPIAAKARPSAHEPIQPNAGHTVDAAREPSDPPMK